MKHRVGEGRPHYITDQLWPTELWWQNAYAVCSGETLSCCKVTFYEGFDILKCHKDVA